VNRLLRDHPSALIGEVTGARSGNVLVSDVGNSGDEYLVDERGQVIDLSFVVPDQPCATEARLPEAELIHGRHDPGNPSSGNG
jgi:hypothetical protein